MSLDEGKTNGMLKRLSRIAAYMMIALGVVHLSFTPFAYRQFTDNTVWFMGAGLAPVFAGFMNIILVRNAGIDRAIYAFCLIANIVLLSFFVLAAFVIPSPPPFIGILLTLITSIAMIALERVSHG